MKKFFYKLFAISSVVTFHHKERDYRLTGYVYIYEPSDYATNKERKILLVPKFLSNGVTGCGVSGCTCKYEDIERLSYHWKRYHYRKDEKHNWTIKEVKELLSHYKFLKTIPKSLTWKEYIEYSISTTIKNLK